MEQKKAIPCPSAKQLAYSLDYVEIRRNYDVMCSAYEPRFRLIACGTAKGQFFIINSKGSVFNSTTEMPFPICSVSGLTNTSSFVSVFSPSLFRSHPNNKIKKFRKNYQDVAEKFPKTSHIAHWVVENQKIDVIFQTIKYDIVSYAVSSMNPLYMLVATNDGSVYGYSLEDMSFTNLYVDSFKNKLIRCMAPINGLNYYICHDSIEMLSLQNHEINGFENNCAVQMDTLGNIVSFIDEKGMAYLFEKGKQIATLNPHEGKVCIYTAIITNKDWLCVVRDSNGDEIYINQKLYKRIENDFIVPNLLVDYVHYFERKQPNVLIFITEKGSMIYINNDKLNRYSLPDLSDGFKPFVDENNMFLVRHNDITNSCDFYIFKNFTFLKKIGYQCRFPLAFKNSNFLCLKNGTFYLFSPLDDDEIELFKLPCEVVKQYSSKNYLDFILSNGKILEFDLQSGMFAFNYHDNDDIAHNIIAWIRIKDNQTDSFITLSDKHTLKFGDKSEKKIFMINSELLLMELINENGKIVQDDPMFLLIVSSSSIKVLDPTNLKVLQKRKLKNIPLDATISEQGTLILQYSDFIEVSYLPNIQYQINGYISLEEKAKAYLIPYHGVIIYENDSLCVYMNQIHKEEIIKNDNGEISLEKPNKEKLLNLPNKTIFDSISRAYQHKRKEGLKETENILQKLLVDAEKRTKKLSELDNNSLKMVLKAQEFYEESRRFKKT